MNESKILVNIVLIAFAIALRSIVSLYPYSGAAKPPMFGDYEAQRHWQEVTVNLPTSQWYENGTDNDLLYWGLDYPPLTAYHSFLVGKVAEFIDPSYVRLHESRGMSSKAHNNFMRLTVLLADVLIYLPAMLLGCDIVYEKVFKMNVRRSAGFKILFTFIALTYPGQILIDNGHFQYNNISLGLAVLAVSMIALRRRIVGAIFFVLALNYKQMELYHALPFFCYLLTNCFVDHDSHRRFGVKRGIARLAGLGCAVLVTFAVIWLPWLDSKDKLLQVLHRVFPIDRGVFEDKVSNVWCIVNVFHKIKSNYTNDQMAKICLAATAAALTPSSLHLLCNAKLKKFLYALVNSSLAFFLFSFQVHEKSILIPACVAILLFPAEPFMVFWFLQVSTFSMLPLLVKDGQVGSFIGLSCCLLGVTKMCIDNMIKEKKCEGINFMRILWRINSNKSTESKQLVEHVAVFCYIVSTLLQVMLIYGFFFVPSPAHLPFLHPLLISAFSCCHFVLFFAYFNVKQILCE